jgi:hypothetical protein
MREEEGKEVLVNCWFCFIRRGNGVQMCKYTCMYAVLYQPTHIYFIMRASQKNKNRKNMAQRLVTDV